MSKRELEQSVTTLLEQEPSFDQVDFGSSAPFELRLGRDSLKPDVLASLGVEGLYALEDYFNEKSVAHGTDIIDDIEDIDFMFGGANVTFILHPDRDLVVTASEVDRFSPVKIPDEAVRLINQHLLKPDYEVTL